MEDYNERRQQQREDVLTSAYMSAYWHRATKMPSLPEILEAAKPKNQTSRTEQIPRTEQTPEQMFANVKRMHTSMAREEG